ncbi:hypothetical protein B7L70_05480 [Vulcanisaeta sp. EB80]|uniref:hypothetical protein n=1 Tax=Vulcanisaeta sp. EB80 TaxID=1650660 RepID=UPI0009BD629E|nr:hypothetical protein [Vulcanisaeta sp. EB80]PLC68018.1 hypothetical protein B7L70_05480 [Vulcanisaeta sp. EB80]
MSNEGFAALMIYLFVTLSIVLPLILIPMGVNLLYAVKLGITASVIGKYVFTMVVLMLFLVIGGVLIYRSGRVLMRFVIKDVVRVLGNHGIFDVFSISSLRLIFMLLVIASIIIYLMNVEVIRIPGYNYIPYLMMNVRDSLTQYLLMTMGLLNLVLSVWLVLSVAYLQLRIAVRHLTVKLGGAVGGVFSVVATTGSAAVTGAVCALGSCTIPSIGVTPLAVILAYLIGGNALLFMRFSEIIMTMLMGITITLLALVHRLLTR